MNNRKVVFFDIDGCYFDKGVHQEYISKYLKEKDIDIIFCTGRSYIRAKAVVSELELKGMPLILENGSRIMEFDGKVLFNSPITDDKIYDKLKEIDNNLIINGYGDSIDNQFITFKKTIDFINCETYQDYGEFLAQCRKFELSRIILVLLTDQAKLIQENLIKNKINCTMTDGNTLHITNKNISKRFGIEFCIKKFGYNLKNITIIGNDYNDIPSFTLNAKNKIAVIHDYSPKELKSMSTHTTDFTNLFKVVQQIFD